MTKYNNVTAWEAPPERNIIGANIGSSDFAEINLGTLHHNTRTMYTNPWGVDTPVYSAVYGYHNGVWSDSTAVYDINFNHSYGIRSIYSEGRGIFVVTGTYYIAMKWDFQLTAFNNINVSDNIKSMPAKLMMWKLNT